MSTLVNGVHLAIESFDLLGRKRPYKFVLRVWDPRRLTIGGDRRFSFVVVRLATRRLQIVLVGHILVLTNVESCRRQLRVPSSGLKLMPATSRWGRDILAFYGSGGWSSVGFNLLLCIYC